MPRFLSQANRFLTLLSLPHRRGYGVASNVSTTVGLDRMVNRNGMVGKIEDKDVGSKDGSKASSAWAPDPVTGYYRPINHANEIDPVELRNMLLNHRVRSTSSSTSST
ncbi:hypothetical protein HN51_065622 [Arachis hypogaea]|nr:late embryogenesis abundant protein Lea5 [Arachis ipaensis]XP_025646605.1 late embryogenesis abundant protein Lea5 [Arachis hypogaea]QHO06826.1 Late embryogenesis abundant protein [Arachis hypogaea]